MIDNKDLDALKKCADQYEQWVMNMNNHGTEFVSKCRYDIDDNIADTLVLFSLVTRNMITDGLTITAEGFQVSGQPMPQVDHSIKSAALICSTLRNIFEK